MISKRTLEKWRKESLKAMKAIKNLEIPRLTEETHDRIIKLTQELLDQHLLNK